MDSEVSHSFACRVKDTLPSSAGSLCLKRTDKTSALHAGTGVPCDITRYLRTNICYFCDSVVR
ncbi:hypothetical protein H112_01584 [Trichophyton rubrum D6]|uniref:Uncharacterized protein n=2 Tax=Trichophyton TaxID=5550 RepID=A0A022WC71_TRIRU|nr:hypothetical protein H100_01580 [Trichophyton rubrum MR850]EZF55962.1 hypothetical protein H103_01588 [Trichophyton rubrum CBS 288.86]EZF66661.1 hypothetical protein H104_01563 [Trichophyton rubrum CBS 289.86]EZF77271.1 hypothetical protein H105_01591 [Trichophyton soudanense CBS 452.61]EZF87960.1 hypothetical protein H110_01583 [Trichophyton rubrum MR1448]EZF98742.1 hypothetical protein H113_01586 [Trichophyton rubrum MR1459]EZG09665.1 hypothetical protein H106_01351 [Trichophyton rubrum 